MNNIWIKYYYDNTSHMQGVIAETTKYIHSSGAEITHVSSNLNVFTFTITPHQMSEYRVKFSNGFRVSKRFKTFQQATKYIYNNDPYFCGS